MLTIKSSLTQIALLETRKSEKESDVATLDLFAQLRRDHIQRYREFISKATEIIHSKDGTQ